MYFPSIINLYSLAIISNSVYNCYEMFQLAMSLFFLLVFFVIFWFSFNSHAFHLWNRLDMFIITNYLSSSCCLVNYIFHLFFNLCFCFFASKVFIVVTINHFYLFCIYSYILKFIQYCTCFFFLWLHVLNKLPKNTLSWSLSFLSSQLF